MSLMKQCAYVMQDNVHYGVLTVRESLVYAAHFRLKETLSEEEKLKQVDKILDMLGLTEVKDTLVGDENTRGVSGGQLKRLSIGVEIISLPDIIFLDEPTTGMRYGVFVCVFLRAVEMLLLCCCVAVLLCCCVDVLLCCCVAVLLCCCVDVLLCCCVDVLLCWCVAVLMCCCVDVLLC
jgi:ABC-type branched-subunit amino acid transport system ATPase component